jgi:hypothetical protein
VGKGAKKFLTANSANRREVCQESVQVLTSENLVSGQRVATSRAPNPTCMEATNCMKLGGGRYQASTKVKVLSPEIYECRRPTAFRDWKAALPSLQRRGYGSPTGSEAKCMIPQGACMNLGEPECSPLGRVFEGKL